MTTNDLPYTGKEYLDSLDDGREVWIYGERVKNVATHPAFRNSARMIARLYDSLHDPAQSEILTVPMENGVGRTHRYFQPPHNVAEQVAARDAIAHWSRMSYGWIGRTPDYKAAWVATLAAASHLYGEYEQNAKRWYDLARKKIPFINHSIVNPPVDRHIPTGASDVFIQVVKETDKGIIVSGAKVVATTAALTQFTFVAHYNVAIKDKKYSPIFIAHFGTPGVKLISRNSYEFQAATTASPFDAPLSSRMDENDAILVFDNALIPWEDVLMYDVESANGFVTQTGFMSRALLQACTRLAVKLDFISGLFLKAVEITGTKDYRGVQAAVGEVIGLRHTMWALSDAMAHSAEPWGKYVLPNFEASLAFRMLAGDSSSRVLNLIQKHVAGALIYLPSNARDFQNPVLRPYLDKYVRGSNGIGAEERVKTLKLLWDAVNSEFASRHELYELNYSGSNEQTRVDPYAIGNITGRNAQMRAFAEECMAEYDLNGWTVPDLINPDDVSAFNRR
ncbi:MAG: 4-hydroxyphenylacetate 3-hydroxylase family protein [Steroidobacteraceae bacterium]